MTATNAAPGNGAATPRGVRSGTVRRVLAYLRAQIGGIAMLLVIIIVDAVLVITPPVLYQRMIDDGIIPGELSILVGLCIVAFTAVLLHAASRIGVSWMGARLGEQLVFRIRRDVYAHTQRLPVAFYTGQRSGALISRLTNDTGYVQGAVSTVLPQLVSSLIRLVLVVAAIAYLSWQVLIIMVVIPLVVALPAKLVGRLLHRVSHDWMRAQAHVTSYITERFNVAGAMLSQLYGDRKRDEDEFVRLSARNRDLAVRMAAVSGMFSAGLGWLSATSVVALYLLGGYLAVSGAMTIGTLVAVAVLVPQLFGPVKSLSEMHVHIMKMVASFERIFELLDRETTVDVVVPAGVPASAKEGTLEFDRVHFSYRPQRGLDDEATTAQEPVPVLHDVSFMIEPGQRVAVVGPSGAGKSTIAGLVPRLHDVDSGVVRIGGRDVRDMGLAALRDEVGVLTQDAHLFHDTIRANLLYAAPDASEKDLVEALRQACIWPLIRTLPDGLDTVVGDRGYRLSGGEKQRLAIGRLLLKNPSIVVLDEATAHLDNESERAVQEAIDRCLIGRTTLVIAHRLSTVRDADQILVMQAGRIVERGEHHELIRYGGLYAKLHAKQRASATDRATGRVTDPALV